MYGLLSVLAKQYYSILLHNVTTLENIIKCKLKHKKIFDIITKDLKRKGEIMNITEKIAAELNIKQSQVESTIKLIDDGNTIPFIARYRKEATGNLSDETLREFGERLTYLRNLEARKEEIIRLIDEQGKLTDELVQAITKAEILSELEDIYRPYKQKEKNKSNNS